MAADTSHLIFELHGVIYATEASCVQEVFYLPELAPFPDAPPDIVGVLNLRGTTLAVIDLDRRFGRRPPPYRLTDSIIVFPGPAGAIGVIVNAVREVRDIPPDAIDRDVDLWRQDRRPIDRAAIAGLAHLDRETIALLDPDALFGDTASLDEVPAPHDEGGDPEEDLHPIATDWVFCPEATEEARAVLRQRRDHLMAATLADQGKGVETAIAVISLGDESYAIELEMVREFIEIRKVAPMPCCPPHILGNTNLRGDVVPVVDVRGFLDLPSVAATVQAAVVEVEGMVAAIAVDGVLDIYNLDAAAVSPVPAVLQGGDRDYLHGIVRHGDRAIGLLHLSKLFTQEGFAIDETVA